MLCTLNTDIASISDALSQVPIIPLTLVESRGQSLLQRVHHMREKVSPILYQSPFWRWTLLTCATESLTSFEFRLTLINYWMTKRSTIFMCFCSALASVFPLCDSSSLVTSSSYFSLLITGVLISLDDS